MRAPGTAEVDRFRALVEQRLGLAFDDTKLALLTEILEQRVRSLGCRSAGEYLGRHLETTGAANELGALAERLTVGETFFFRDRDQFRALREVALPEILERRRAAQTLRVLSAGCASGDEPHSVAIVLRESVADLDRWDVTIRGIDINPAALRSARSGRCSPWSLRETPADLRERYFQADGSRSWRLDDEIRRAVAFAQRNLGDDDPAFFGAGVFDVIFCRNVLMYLSPRAAQLAVGRLAGSLAPGGFLFLGTAETLRGLSDAFHLRHERGAFLYQLRDGPSPRPGPPPPPAGRRRAPAPAPLPVPAPSGSWMRTIQQASQRIDELAHGRAAASRPPAGPRGGPRASPAAVARARNLMQQERFADALDLLMPLAAEEGADPDALLLRAILLTNQGQPRQAEALCREVLVRDELNAGAHYLLALCYEHAADRAAAADHDQYALYLDPSFAMARLHLALMAHRRGDLEAARRELGQAMILLAREDASRIVLYGGGFTRDGLLALCRSELRACGGEV